MKNRRFVNAERKSFDLILEGEKEDVIRISENGRKRRTSIMLGSEESGWLMDSWGKAWRDGTPSGWYRRWRGRDKSLFLQIQQNKWGRFVVLTEIGNGRSRFMIIPEGGEQRCWKELFKAFEELFGMTKIEKVRGKLVPKVRERRGVHETEGGKQEKNRRMINREEEPPRKHKIQLRLELQCPHCSRSFHGDAEADVVMSTRRQKGEAIREDEQEIVGGYQEAMVDDDGRVEAPAATVNSTKTQGEEGDKSQAIFKFQKNGPSPRVGPNNGPVWANDRKRATRQNTCKIGGVTEVDGIIAQNGRSSSKEIEKDYERLTVHRQKKTEEKGRMARKKTQEMKSGKVSQNASLPRAEAACMWERGSIQRFFSNIRHAQQGLTLVYRRKSSKKDREKIAGKGIRLYEEEGSKRQYARREWTEKLKGLERASSGFSSVSSLER